MLLSGLETAEFKEKIKQGGEELEDFYPKVQENLEMSSDMKGKEGEEFDALRLLKTLPQELFDEVLAKLPFESLVRFRSVSKRWKSVVIPHAALKARASTVSALLYIDDSRESDHAAGGRGNFRPSCFHLGDSKSEWTTKQNFNLSCNAIPIPGVDERAKLVVSEGGLLGFCYIHSARPCERETVTNIVVCNPVLGQAQTIGLPPAFLQKRNILMGIISYAETQSFKFVIAYGWDPLLLVYDSQTGVWKNSIRFLAGPPVGQSQKSWDLLSRFFRFNRSVCFNGNLYWFQSSYRSTNCVLEYILDSDSWNRISVGENKACTEWRTVYGILGCKGAVLVSHICFPYPDSADLVTHRVYCAIRETSSALFHPAIKMMDWVMVENTERHLFQLLNGANVQGCESYGLNNFVFHVITYGDDEDEDDEEMTPPTYLRIIVCDTLDNSFKALPLLKTEPRLYGSFPSLRTITSCDFYCTDKVWAFLPSIIPVT